MPLELLPEAKKSAKQFILCLIPKVLQLFDAPQKILGYNVLNKLNQQVYAMDEETATRNLTRLKELLNEW